MNGDELLRLIEVLQTSKDIPREVIFRGWRRLWPPVFASASD